MTPQPPYPPDHQGRPPAPPNQGYQGQPYQPDNRQMPPPTQPYQPYYTGPQPGPGGYYGQPPQSYPPSGPGPQPKPGFPVWGWLLIGGLLLAVVGAVIFLAVLRPAQDAGGLAGAISGTSQAGQAAGTPAGGASGSAPTGRVGKIGEPFSKDGYIITIHKVERSKNFGNQPAYLVDLQPGYTLLALDVTFESAKSNIIASKLLSVIKDKQDNSYSPVGLGAKEPLFVGTDKLPQGQKVRGWITYEVPENATGLIFDYIVTDQDGYHNFQIALE